MVKHPHIVTLDGEWDIARREELQKLLEPSYETPGEVILDLRTVTYADSTILAGLIVARNRRRGKGYPVPRLVIGSRQLRRLFAIAGLDDAFPIYETLDEAVAEE